MVGVCKHYCASHKNNRKLQTHLYIFTNKQHTNTLPYGIHKTKTQTTTLLTTSRVTRRNTGKEVSTTRWRYWKSAFKWLFLGNSYLRPTANSKSVSLIRMPPMASVFLVSAGVVMMSLLFSETQLTWLFDSSVISNLLLFFVGLLSLEDTHCCCCLQTELKMATALNYLCSFCSVLQNRELNENIYCIFPMDNCFSQMM